MANNNQRFTIDIQPTKDKTYNNLQKGVSYTIMGEVTPHDVVSLEVYTRAITYGKVSREFSSTVVNRSVNSYFYNGRRAKEMGAVLGKGFDQIFNRSDYPQLLKNAITDTLKHLEDKFGA